MESLTQQQQPQQQLQPLAVVHERRGGNALDDDRGWWRRCLNAFVACDSCHTGVLDNVTLLEPVFEW